MLCNFCCYPCLPHNLSFKICRNSRISKKAYKVPSFPGLYFRDFLKINVFAKMSENQKNYKSYGGIRKFWHVTIWKRFHRFKYLYRYYIYIYMYIYIYIYIYTSGHK